MIGTAWIAVYENFAVMIVFAKRSRFTKIVRQVRSFVPALVLALISYCVLGGVLGIWSSALPFTSAAFGQLVLVVVCSAILHSVSSTVVSEWVTFADKDLTTAQRALGLKSRLGEGLASSGVFQFLAFEDLLNVATGQAVRRNYLFKDAGGEDLMELFDVCTTTLKSLRVYYGRLGVQVSQTPSPSPSPTPIEAMLIAKRLRLRVLRPFISYQRQIDHGSRVNMRELIALDQSVLALFVVKSLVHLLDVLAGEDRFGIGQQRAETITQALLETRSAIQPVLGYRWTLPDFGRGWFVRSPFELIVRTREVLDWSLNQIATKFRGRIDLTQGDFSRESAAAFRSRPEDFRHKL
jgi:hypothetical protein